MIKRRRERVSFCSSSRIVECAFPKIEEKIKSETTGRKPERRGKEWRNVKIVERIQWEFSAFLLCLSFVRWRKVGENSIFDA